MCLGAYLSANLDECPELSWTGASRQASDEDQASERRDHVSFALLALLDADRSRAAEQYDSFHLDVDPLKERMAFATYPAVLRAKVDGALALEQLIEYVSASPSFADAQKTISSRLEALTEKKKQTVKHLRSLEVAAEGDILTPSLVVATYRKLLESQQLRSLVVNEAISNYGPVWEHLEPSEPGSALSSGASSLGWALGAAIGAKMAAADYSTHTKDVVTVFVGDGSFIFGVPSASYWMARRYETASRRVSLGHSFEPSD